MFQAKCPECGKEIAVAGARCPSCGQPLSDHAGATGSPAAEAPASRLAPQQFLIPHICGLGAVLMIVGGGAGFWGEVILLAGIGWFLATRLGAR